MTQKIVWFVLLTNISLLGAIVSPAPPANISSLKGLKNSADASQKKFMDNVKNANFKNEEFRKLFLLWLDTIKNKMKVNKAALQKKSDAEVAKKVRREGKISDENNIEKMSYDIEWLSAYYKIIDTELIPLEAIVLEAYQRTDHIIAPTEFTKRFDTIFKTLGGVTPEKEIKPAPKSITKKAVKMAPAKKPAPKKFTLPKPENIENEEVMVVEE